MEVLTGSIPDISPILAFKWWEPVYYKVDDSDFPSETRKLRGHFVGISKHVGHAMTFKILTDDTQKIIHRSNVCSALDPNESNLCVDPIQSSLSPIIKSKLDNSDGETPMPIVNPADLIGKVFTMDSGESGES